MSGILKPKGSLDGLNPCRELVSSPARIAGKVSLEAYEDRPYVRFRSSTRSIVLARFLYPQVEDSKRGRRQT